MFRKSVVKRLNDPPAPGQGRETRLVFHKCSGRISGCWKIHPLCPVRDRPAGGLLLHLDAFTRFNIKKRQLSQDTRRIRKVRSCTQIYLQHTYHTQSHWMSQTHRAQKPKVSVDIIFFRYYKR